MTESYIIRAETWLLITTLSYFLINGAQIFETLVFVPKWTRSPPENYKLLLDGSGASLKEFWIVFHSLHELTFILAIIFCWRIESIRNWLLILFGIHFLVRVCTILYFAPAIMSFQKAALAPKQPTELDQRTALWKKLNYIRVAIFILLSLALLPLCIQMLSFRL